ncbi:GNAT family N-acetyltransferase [Rubellimicrobium rubrum]|uniref:GNAT family N-acetyltransferase n=2 Tax=Rubellimicrobium rubrum TaxID=2585369 RepID=A0A5C4MN89_9RHOB|nr:GNAT family N-acetyltransferase [Rubellimicrobium rubrum]
MPPQPGPAADLAEKLCALVPALETERLRLRAPTLADFPAWAEILCSPRSVHMDGPYTRDEAFTEFAATVGSWLLRGHGPWTIESRASGEVLGFVCLNMEPSDQEPELGYFLREGAEGHGFAAEATFAARAQGWALGLPSLVSYIDPPNARSVALAERLGARRDRQAEAALAGTGSEGALVYRHLRPEIAP